MSEKKLRVAFVDYVLEPDKPGRSGLSDTIWDMASELTNQGHHAHIVASYHTNQYPDPRVSVHNFPTPPIGYRNIVGHIWILKRAAEIIERLQPDIVHTREYISTAVLATLGIREPLVLTVPGNIFKRLRDGHDYEWYFVQILKWAARTSARRCTSVIATSQEMKRWWEWTGSPPERTYWIPLGVNQERFHPVPDARKQLGLLLNDKQFLLYVGRFSKEKGILDLISVLAQLKSLLHPLPIKVILVGKGPQEEEIKQCIDAEDLGKIVQVRSWVSQDELRIWFSAADALLMPSWNEPFGKVMIEAMACATPVIASATEGPSDHIRNGQNGFLFTPRDCHELAEILKQVIFHPEVLKSMRPISQDYVQKHLSWPRIVERITEEVYIPIIKQTNSSLLIQK